MRLLSAAGVLFGWLSIGMPLAIATARCSRSRSAPDASRRSICARVIGSLLRPPLPRWQRLVWIGLLGWLALRFLLLAADVAWQPLYPWDAWVQWATKARVWYELGRIAPFVRAEQWFASPGGAYFDAAPNYPATVPLLQVWSCIALGRWDDSAMNWPWLLLLIALTCAVYGALRGEGVGAACCAGRRIPGRIAAAARHACGAGRLRRSADGHDLHVGGARFLSLGDAARPARRGARARTGAVLSADQDSRRWSGR